MADISTVQIEYLDRLDAEVGLRDYQFPLPGWRRGYRTTNIDDWARDRATPLVEWRHRYCYRYSWAIPNAEAVAAAAALSPIVEMGAGTGYWAHLLAASGADVVAYDRWPPTGSNPTQDEDDEAVITARARESGAVWHANERPWSPVQAGDPSALLWHADRTLLLVWPPYDDPMAADCLDHWRGDRLIYVGEGSGGCTASDEFHERLDREFEEERTVQIPQWDGLHDYLMVYRRTP